MSTKNEQLLAASNFHQIREHQKQQAKAKAKEEAKRKLAVQRSLEYSLLDDHSKELGSENWEPPTPMLAEIEEMEEEEKLVGVV